MICEISEFIDSLNGVSGYLAKYNPSQSLLKLIGTFDGNSYVEGVKSHIQKLIGEIDNLDVKTKYEQIIWDIRSVSIPYNKNLDRSYKNFKEELEKHKTSLEEKIKKYIENINKRLKEHSSRVQELIKLICKDINNFNTNYSKIRKSSGYYRPKSIFKDPNLIGDITTINQIFLTLVNYRNDSRIFNSRKRILSQIIEQLKFYSDQFVNKTVNYEENKSGSNIVDPVLNPLQGFKAHVDRFISNIECVQKLQEIGEYIKTMKSQLEPVKGKVLPQVESYIQGLANIDIKHSDVQESINKIKNMNNNIICRLQIARHTIDLYNTLKEEISKLTHTYYYHNDIDYLKHELSTVKGKLQSFETNINGVICKAKKEIEKIKKETEEPTTTEVICDDKKLKEDDNDAISKVLGCFESSLKDIPNIKSFIDNSLNDIDVIKYLVHLIQNKKNQSVNYLNNIKSKVGEINQLKGATKTLNEAAKDLNKFLQVQKNTKSLIDTFKLYPKFGSLGQYFNEQQNIISESKRVIGLINYYSDYLRTIGYVENLINCIKGYKSRFETIRGIIKKFKPNVKEIIARFGRINKDLCLLKTPYYRKKVENNLWRLKDYMTYLKVYVTNIRENFNVICGVIDKIKKETFYIGRYRSELESLEKYIECYIKWIENCKKIIFIVNYLKSINDKMNEILIIKNMIINCSHTKYIEKIQCRLKGVESNVSELEYAIEGVASNFLFEYGNMRMNTTSMIVTRPHGHNLL